MPSALEKAITPAHILIAEDSSVQILLLRRILEDQGYKVSSAKDGQAALDMANQIKPTLIISDVNMPEMNGYELCKRIKISPGLENTPVILMTVLQEPEDLLNGLQSGADSFVVKPYNRSHILARVEHALSRRDIKIKPDEDQAMVFSFRGEKRFIDASREQILSMLMSTYETSVQRSKDIHESRENLRELTTQLSQSNQFLNLIIDNIPNMIFIKDAADLKFVRLNKAGEDLTGYSSDQVIGKNDFDLFPKEDADFFFAKDRELLANSARVEITEKSIITAHNGKRLLRTKKVAVLDDKGVATHLLGISEDVTDKKALENAILALNSSLALRANELEGANKSLENFTAAVTHDLRSPLTIIGGYAGILEKQYASLLDEKGRRCLRVINATTKRMAKLIDDLLAFSRLGLIAIDKSNVDVHKLAEQVLADILQLHPEDKKPTVVMEQLPPAQADTALLRQVWVNLLSNAVKYSSRAASPAIEVKGRIVDKEIVYSVRDNGAGFDMANYDKLFAMFERLHSDHEFEGSGVGLPIVHRIVTRHGGRVWAEGKVGEGAVFHFSLPH